VAGFARAVLFSMGMDPNTTALERAFQLAKSGLCGSVNEIRNQLKLEGYSTAYITGKGLMTQLKALIHSAKTPK
jgi:hypothetical protein